ncbi:hypothetical protein Tco_0815210 [Tanacetum coccineum]
MTLSYVASFGLAKVVWSFGRDNGGEIHPQGWRRSLDGVEKRECEKEPSGSSSSRAVGSSSGRLATLGNGKPIERIEGPTVQVTKTLTKPLGDLELENKRYIDHLYEMHLLLNPSQREELENELGSREELAVLQVEFADM